MKKVFTRTLPRLLFGILLAFALLLIALTLNDGPVTAHRIVTRGNTTVYDYKRFPGRNLSASSNPFHFEVDLQNGIVPETILIDGSEENLNYILDSSRTLAFLVIKGDVIVYERYMNGRDESAISQVFSTSKSILSILIGTAIDDGLIKSVQDPVTDYIPELANAGFERVTIENLLNMQSNLDYFETDNPFGKHVIFNFTNQLEAEILKLRLISTPDEQFRYKSGDNALLGLILDRALGGKTITHYMQERLWNPLGMEHGGVWGVDRQDGLERTWCCLSMSARDLAKFGRLYLENGNWDSAQIVSSGWVKKSTTGGAYTAREWTKKLSGLGASNYKYQWWLLSNVDGNYSTWGKDGQYLYVSPQKRLIIVRLGETDGGLAWFKIFQAIVQGMKFE